MNNFLRDFSSFADNKHVKHIAHKLSPISDALIGKATSKVQSLKTGGRVNTKGRKSAMVRLHKNEYVLPANVKPTKAQKMAVAKNKKKK